MSSAQSPFKFLDAYEKSDVKVFFGRDKETTELYDALSGTKFLLVYGPSGSGKTSLVECGLRNRFSPADWFALTIRKGNDMNRSIYTALNEALNNKIPLNASGIPEDESIDIVKAVKKLFKERYQPIYLLFDQFEELLISGNDKEKRNFFESMNDLMMDNTPCRIMLIMREEFIGHLSEFESIFPSVMKNRYRVEKMGRTQVQQVVQSMLEAPQYLKHFDVEDSLELANKILEKLPDKRKEIELSHVQVFLGELWDRANLNKPEGELPVFSTDLLKKNDNLESVLESFLQKQMEELEATYGKGVPLELLATIISEKFTKLQRTEEDIIAELESKQVTNKKPINELLENLQSRRIIRSIKLGDDNQYEISHDTLALVVGQNLTEEMKMREKAMDVYKVYEERTGLLSQDEIDYLRPFKQSLDYPPYLHKRIEESNIAILNQKQKELQQLIDNKNKRKKIKILGIAMSILLGAIAMVIFLAIKAQKEGIKAKQQKVQAELAKDEANNYLNLVTTGQKRYDSLKGNDSLIKAKLYREKNDPLAGLITPKGSISRSNQGGNNYKNYTFWIDVPSFRKHQIKEVHYRFCRGFTDRLRISRDPSSSFSIGYLGWDFCLDGVDIILDNGKIIETEILENELIIEE